MPIQLLVPRGHTGFVNTIHKVSQIIKDYDLRATIVIVGSYKDLTSTEKDFSEAYAFPLIAPPSSDEVAFAEQQLVTQVLGKDADGNDISGKFFGAPIIPDQPKP